MSFDPAIATWVAQQGWGIVSTSRPLAGGDINEAFALYTSDGPTLFLKRNAQAPEDLFTAEAAGLAALRAANVIRVPQTYLVGRGFLLLEYIAPTWQQPDYWARLGRQLARLHHHIGPYFGFASDNYCGLTPQQNTACEDGFLFFAERRLQAQAQLAYQRGLLPKADLNAIETLAQRLEQWIPEQPPSLLHGDLWSGNVHCGPQGEPLLIDPATYWGWAEAELGMTRLFGAFPPAFYAAYQEIRPLLPGWEERLDLYNLYHLLNHLNLFGQSYLASVRRIHRRYV